MIFHTVLHDFCVIKSVSVDLWQHIFTSKMLQLQKTLLCIENYEYYE